MGGFLQVILFGYTGFRLHLDHLSANPKLPPGQTNLTIQGTFFALLIYFFFLFFFLLLLFNHYYLIYFIIYYLKGIY